MAKKTITKNKNKKGSVLPKITSKLISAYVHICGFLTRYQTGGDPISLELMQSGKPVLFAFWHNQQCFMLYPYRNRDKVAVLVSMSRDGEFIASALPNFKMTPVRGSTSRGGFSALRSLIDMAEKGYTPAITPDGPRGPAHKAHTGILFLAQKTGLPILSAGVASSNKIAVNSWDKFQIPLPFGKCAIVYGELLYVRPEDEMTEMAKNLTNILNKATDKAVEMVS